MPSRLAAPAIAGAIAATGCAELPHRWEERGFPSEEA